MTPKDDSKTVSDHVLIRFIAYLCKSLNDTMISYSRELRRQRDIYNVLMQSNPCVDDNNEIYEQSNFFKDQIELPELDRALNTLNRRYRYILFARAVEGRSFEEIGAELGLDYKGVAAIYYRARNKIRKEMGEKYEF